MLVVKNTVLLIIDFQGNLAQAMYEKQKLFENVKKIIQGAQSFGIPIIVTEQIPEKLGPTIFEISDLIKETPPIPKASFSCCSEEIFMDVLRSKGCTQILVAGIESHICVYQTTVDLIKKGYQVHVLCDCISSRVEENRRIGIERMIDEGAKRASVEMALFELLKTAENTIFRAIIKIVK